MKVLAAIEGIAQDDEDRIALDATRARTMLRAVVELKFGEYNG